MDSKRRSAVSIFTILFMAIAGVFGLAGHSSADAVPLLSPDVLIDVGHGGIDGGTSEKPWLEKNINLDIAKLLQKSLNEHRIRAMLNRWTDMAPSDDNHWLRSRSRHLRDLAQRKLVMEQLNPKVVVSLHCNWSSRSSRHGPIVLYQANQQSYTLAHLVQNHLNALYGTDHRPFHGKTFYILKHSPKPTIIVEMGFISSPVDQQMLTLRRNQTKIADAIGSAISEYLLAFHVNETRR